MRTDRSLYRIFLRKSTDFLRRIIVPVEGQGGVTLSYVCPHCHRFPLEDHIWWFSSGHGKKRCSLWCAACVGQYNWKAPNRALVTQDSTNRRDAKVFRALAAPQEMCHNWINALTLWANQQQDRDRPVKMVAQGSEVVKPAQNNGRAQTVRHGRQP